MPCVSCQQAWTADELRRSRPGSTVTNSPGNAALAASLVTLARAKREGVEALVASLCPECRKSFPTAVEAVTKLESS